MDPFYAFVSNFRLRLGKLLFHFQILTAQPQIFPTTGIVPVSLEGGQPGESSKRYSPELKTYLDGSLAFKHQRFNSKTDRTYPWITYGKPPQSVWIRLPSPVAVAAFRYKYRYRCNRSNHQFFGIISFLTSIFLHHQFFCIIIFLASSNF